MENMIFSHYYAEALDFVAENILIARICSVCTFSNFGTAMQYETTKNNNNDNNINYNNDHAHNHLCSCGKSTFDRIIFMNAPLRTILENEKKHIKTTYNSVIFQDGKLHLKITLETPKKKSIY